MSQILCSLEIYELIRIEAGWHWLRISSRILRLCLEPQMVTWEGGTIAQGIYGHSFRSNRMVPTIIEAKSC